MNWLRWGKEKVMAPAVTNSCLLTSVPSWDIKGWNLYAFFGHSSLEPSDIPFLHYLMQNLGPLNKGWNFSKALRVWLSNNCQVMLYTDTSCPSGFPTKACWFLSSYCSSDFPALRRRGIGCQRVRLQLWSLAASPFLFANHQRQEDWQKQISHSSVSIWQELCFFGASCFQI